MPLTRAAASRAVVLAVLGLLGPLVLFAALADEVADGDSFGWDAQALAFLRARISEAPAVAAASYVQVGVVVAAAVVLAGFLLRRHRADALSWLATMGGTALFAPLLDEALERGEGRSPFPSASAMALTALVAGLAFLLPRARWAVAGVGTLAGLLAGAALVASQRDHASDVLGGWVAGIAWATAVSAAAPALRERSHARARLRAPARTRGHDGRARRPQRQGVVEVVYIAGPARAGSTLLDLILNRVLGTTAVGELQYIWERGVVANEPCGCGRPFADCPFWRAVGRRAFGGWENADAERVLELQHEVGRLRHWPWLLTGRMRPGFQARASEYAGHVERLYAAIAAVSGSAVVVDSSKAPGPMLLLSRMRRVDARVVHLVRDSRGVAFSWERRLRRLPDGDDYMPTYAPARSAVGWVALTLPPHLARAAGLRRRLVRYEELLSRPRDEVEGLLRFVGASGDEAALRELEHGAVAFGPNHIVSGNPLRFRREPAPLAIDLEWRTAMRRRDRVAVSLLTWPLQAIYGYGRRRRVR